MRLLSSFVIWLCLGAAVFAQNKLEVFELQNREATSLVSVISSVIGPEGRVTADERTNSLIVSYPANRDADLRRIIQQLDRAEPNIRLELITIEARNDFINRLGLTGKTSLGPDIYSSLVPLLTQSNDVQVEQRQRVTTRNNAPARIAMSTGPVVLTPDRNGRLPPPPQSQYLEVVPSTRANGQIEVRLASVSPAATGGYAPTGRLFTTVSVEDGGALIIGGLNSSESRNKQTQTPLFPIGVESGKDSDYQRISLLHVQLDGAHSK